MAMHQRPRQEKSAEDWEKLVL